MYLNNGFFSHTHVVIWRDCFKTWIQFFTCAVEALWVFYYYNIEFHSKQYLYARDVQSMVWGAVRTPGLSSNGKDQGNKGGVRSYLRLVSLVFLVMQGNFELSSNAITLLMLLRLAYLGSYRTLLILKIRWPLTMSSRPFESPPPYRPDEL